MSDDKISDKQDPSTAEMLRRIQTAESVLLTIPRDAFEKLYLSPKLPTAGNLHRTFGNPTPISLMGFLLAATPTAMLTMGWRGAGSNGGAILYDYSSFSLPLPPPLLLSVISHISSNTNQIRPVYIFFGGIVQLLGAIGEWIFGNTFSCALFFTYGMLFYISNADGLF